jgi:hypothetical protein
VQDIESWHGADELTAATGGRDEQLGQVIGRIGADRVAALLAAEVAARAEVPPGAEGAAASLIIRHGGAAYPYAITFKDTRALVGEGVPDDAVVQVSYALTDLVRLLYPHRPGYVSASRDVEVLRWPWDSQDGSSLTPEHLDEMVRRGEIDPEQLSAIGAERLAMIFRVVQCVSAACSAGSASLDDLSARFGSDKWGGLHWYTPHYATHFAPLRHDPVTVLEIGIGGYEYESLGGESLYMWQRFFPRGLIYGMDLYAKPGVRGPRIRTIQGDQNDRGFLRSLGERLGPFDIVIDDGSHLNEHVRTSFEELYRFVRPGGYYVIEDLHTSYWPEFGGQVPPGSAQTSMGLLKDLLDELNVSEHAGAGLDRSQLAHPSEVHAYHDIAFLRKGINHERGIPEFIRQASTQAGAFGSSSLGDRASSR